MKQQKRHRAFEKPVLKPLSWSVALSILVYIAWASNVHYVTFHFENEQLGKQNLQSDSDFYNQATPGDKYIFTLQNGFFNIPVIKDKTKQ